MQKDGWMLSDSVICETAPRRVERHDDKPRCKGLAQPGPDRLAQGGREAELRARDVTCKALLPLFLCASE